MKKWFHVTFATHGTWLPGDERGFRSRKHRIHSSGDYRNPPPPNEHAGLRRYMKENTWRPEVTLDPKQRDKAGTSLVRKFTTIDCRVIAVAVARVHVHVQGQFEAKRVKDEVGRAKQFASQQLGRDLPGKVWANGCRAEPIKNRAHQIRVFNYIVEHRKKEGAWVWTFRDPIP